MRKSGQLLVYVCAPYEAAQAANVRRAVVVGERIRVLGHLPYIPHLCHLWDLVMPHEQAFYVAMDADWIVRCDVMVVVDFDATFTPSRHVSEDIAVAANAGKPICYSLAQFEEDYGA